MKRYCKFNNSFPYRRDPDLRTHADWLQFHFTKNYMPYYICFWDTGLIQRNWKMKRYCKFNSSFPRAAGSANWLQFHFSKNYMSYYITFWDTGLIQASKNKWLKDIASLFTVLTWCAFVFFSSTYQKNIHLSSIFGTMGLSNLSRQIKRNWKIGKILTRYCYLEINSTKFHLLFNCNIVKEGIRVFTTSTYIWFDGDGKIKLGSGEAGYNIELWMPEDSSSQTWKFEWDTVILKCVIPNITCFLIWILKRTMLMENSIQHFISGFRKME